MFLFVVLRTCGNSTLQNNEFGLVHLHFTVPDLGKCLSLHMIFRKGPEYLNNFSLPLQQL